MSLVLASWFRLASEAALPRSGSRLVGLGSQRLRFGHRTCFEERGTLQAPQSVNPAQNNETARDIALRDRGSGDKSGQQPQDKGDDVERQHGLSMGQPGRRQAVGRVIEPGGGRADPPPQARNGDQGHIKDRQSQHQYRHHPGDKVGIIRKTQLDADGGQGETEKLRSGISHKDAGRIEIVKQESQTSRQ